MVWDFHFWASSNNSMKRTYDTGKPEKYQEINKITTFLSHMANNKNHTPFIFTKEGNYLETYSKFSQKSGKL